MGCCTSVPKQDGDEDDHHDASVTNVNPPAHPPLQPPTVETAPSKPPVEVTASPETPVEETASSKAPRTAPLQPPTVETAPSKPPGEVTAPPETPDEGTMPFPQYTFAELRAATDEFSLQNVLSRLIGDEFPSFVHRGRLHGGQQIAVKRFCKDAWPDAEEFKFRSCLSPCFLEVATAVGRLRHRRLVKLIGYCCHEDERLLVAEFMPNDTLSTHLFNLKFKTMEWSRRLRVACYIAEALEYCSSEGQTLYHGLNSNKVVFDEAGNPCLSCFDLVKNSRDGRSYNINIPYMAAYMPPECLIGMVTPESVIFSFGIVLLDLLHMIMRKEIHTFMDSRLNSEYSLKAATALKELASQCLLNNPKDRPTIKDANAALAQVQSNTRISFPMAEAVTRMDLTAIHQILVLAHYKGDEAILEKGFTAATENRKNLVSFYCGSLSFQDWQHMREMLEARNRGDLAFNDKDLKTAIECYSQLLDKGKLVSATVHVRRSLCYLMSAQPDKALHDAMQAQRIQANLPMALYMHAVALCLLNMTRESSYMLNEAAALEKQRPRNSRLGA
ncbi:Non-specific serine/threonine protein kinase protein [Dioscorea alata]|uniref:Non-specific serine/threonine protein kinase protein n=1 Tax=Dioscorea alata TaxID=55571 RepID=A0ACB7V6C7_DIOAL|nr:Non-specific serine/threonine protein kinase protein [Dioscorea alata]